MSKNAKQKSKKKIKSAEQAIRAKVLKSAKAEPEKPPVLAKVIKPLKDLPPSVELNQTLFLPQKNKALKKTRLPAASFRLKKAGVDFIAAAAAFSDRAEEEDIFAPKPYHDFLNLWIPRGWYKKIAVFALMTLALILPLQAYTYYQGLQSAKERVLFLTEEAIENLKTGSQKAAALDLNGADFQFNQAKNNFFSAQKEINDLNALTSEIIKLMPGPGQMVAAGLNLLEAGQIVADCGQLLIDSGQSFLNSGDLNAYFRSLQELRANLEKVIANFYQAQAKIRQVKSRDLPAAQREKLKNLAAYLPTVEKGLTDLYTLNRALLKILGQKQWQRYLLIFLNNNELRGGGGFMGSFAVLDIDQGQIKKLDIPGGGTYSIQGQLVPKVISPEPLHLVNPRWEFQDANWWPDFPAAAKKIQWFYQNAGGPSLDGVMTIDASIMEDLLEIFGPIPMPEYKRVITGQNFIAETQKIVELEYDKKENKPKQFLADLAPKLLAKVFAADKKQLPKLFAVIKDGLNQKNIQVYSNDQKIENLLGNFGWQGEIKTTSGDYLAVIHSHLASGKTNSVIKEIIQHQAEVQPDGSIIDTVKLIRRHTGVKGENIFTGVQNNSYVRFYLPLGSTLLSAEGFKIPPLKLFEKPGADFTPDADLLSLETQKTKDEKTGTDIYQESGKTVFGNWLQIKPGEVQETVIKYRLPFKLAWEKENTFYYSLLAQKQPSSLGSELKSDLKLNDGLKLLAKFPANLSSDDNSVSFSATLNADQFWGAVLVTK